MDFEKDVQIDPDALDVEWARQPFLYMKYAEEVAEADKVVRQKKEALEVVRANIDRSLRDNAEKKPTENQIANAIPIQPEYQKANSEYSEALYRYSICVAAVRAMDHKKGALENLVKLWQGSYFAGPKEPRNLSEQLSNVSESAVDRQRDRERDRLNRKRKDH